MEKSTQPPAGKTKSHVSWLLAFLVFIIVLVGAARHFSTIEKDFLLLEKIKPWWLVAAIGAQLFTYFFIAFSYRVLLGSFRPANLPPLADMIKASVTSLFFNQTVPSAGVSGNIFFFRYLISFGIAFNAVTFIILAELLIFYGAVLLIIVLLVVGTEWLSKTPSLFITTLAIGFLVYSLFATLVVLAGEKNRLSRLYGKVATIRFLRKILQGAEQSMHGTLLPPNVGLTDLWRSRKFAALKSLCAELAILAADALTVDALFYGLGTPVPFFDALLAIVCTQVVSLLPSLPGSLVLYESSMTIFFTQLEVPLGSAIVVTLSYRLLSFWLPMPFGLMFSRQWLRRTGRTSRNNKDEGNAEAP